MMTNPMQRRPKHLIVAVANAVSLEFPNYDSGVIPRVGDCVKIYVTALMLDVVSIVFVCV